MYKKTYSFIHNTSKKKNLNLSLPPPDLQQICQMVSANPSNPRFSYKYTQMCL